MHFRPAAEADLDELVCVQEEASVVALAHVFPQATHPFPRAAILERWRTELHDPDVAVYISTDEVENVTGFAARRHDELLHFGTAIRMWGTGLACDLHDALVGTYPHAVERIWLRVFEGNHRARRFWEKQGWQPNGRTSRSPFPPHPILVGYELHVSGARRGAPEHPSSPRSR
jgi:RimJ/RimL family protein N-acetyltransferase